MTWGVRVVRDAEAEFESSARWYEQRAGLRSEFVGAIDEAVYAIAEGPLRYPRGAPSRRTASTSSAAFRTSSSTGCATSTLRSSRSLTRADVQGIGCNAVEKRLADYMTVATAFAIDHPDLRMIAVFTDTRLSCTSHPSSSSSSVRPCRS